MSLWKAKQDVTIQDGHSPTVIAKFNEVHDSTTMTVQNVLDAYVITVASTTGIVVAVPGISKGSHTIIFNVQTGRFYTGSVISIAGLIVTLDTQLDSVFPSGSFVDFAITNMNVDGSGTPRIFGLRGLGVIPGINVEVDITRIIFTCYTTTPVSLALFGNLPLLLRGLVLRSRNGETFNIFNVKSNGEIAGITLDWIPYAKTKPNEGQDGFTARLTFTKLGGVQRLAVGEDLEIIVQDNLASGVPDITFLGCEAEGSLVTQ